MLVFTLILCDLLMAHNINAGCVGLYAILDSYFQISGAAQTFKSSYILCFCSFVLDLDKMWDGANVRVVLARGEKR